MWKARLKRPISHSRVRDILSPSRTHYSALVNGTNGDVTLEPVQAKLAETEFVAQGQVAGVPGKEGTRLVVEITSDAARIQDFLYLFMQTKPPLQGSTRFKAKVELPVHRHAFPQTLVMNAQFGIKGSQFTKTDTREKVNALSEASRGNPSDSNPPTVLTDLLGDVALANATAKFSRISFRAPGVSAFLHGNYNLENEKVDLHGTMHTDVNLSQATTGFKAFMMKVIEFTKQKKKQQGGATVPVSITGTYDKPSFGIDAPSEH